MTGLFPPWRLRWLLGALLLLAALPARADLINTAGLSLNLEEGWRALRVTPPVVLLLQSEDGRLITFERFPLPQGRAVLVAQKIQEDTKQELTKQGLTISAERQDRFSEAERTVYETSKPGGTSGTTWLLFESDDYYKITATSPKPSFAQELEIKGILDGLRLLGKPVVTGLKLDRTVPLSTVWHRAPVVLSLEAVFLLAGLILFIVTALRRPPRQDVSA